MIPIVPYIPPGKKGQKPNSLLLAVSILLFLLLGFLIMAFSVNSDFSINWLFIILGVISLIAILIPILVAVESNQNSTPQEKPAIVNSAKYQTSVSQPTWEKPFSSYRSHPPTRQYCTNCGSLVDKMDFFCASCGERLE
jgi:hypothetical protein